MVRPLKRLFVSTPCSNSIRPSTDYQYYALFFCNLHYIKSKSNFFQDFVNLRTGFNAIIMQMSRDSGRTHCSIRAALRRCAYSVVSQFGAFVRRRRERRVSPYSEDVVRYARPTANP